VNGVNVLAAEIHQNAINSTDISFDLELLANPVLSVAPTVVVTSPLSNAVITTPGMTAPVTYAANASVTDPCAGIIAVQFYVNGVFVATDDTAPYTVTVDEPLGTYSVTARAFANNGTRADSAPVSFRVVMVAPVVAAGGVWKYLDDGSDQGAVWRAPGFDDSAWASGPAELGYGDAVEGRPEATLVNGGPVGNRFITTYFRHTFNVPDASAFSELNIGVVRDDGVVVYLNGTELFRMNMPAPPELITSSTLALVAVAGTDEATFFPATVPLTPGLLHNGANVLAAEIHQNTNTSSDISFDLFMDGVKGRPPCGPLTITRQGNLITIGWPDGGVLEVANEVTGPWTPLPDAISPYETAATNRTRFFRLRCPAISVSTDRTLYQPNQPVTANVQVTVGGNLIVDVFDPEAPQGAASVLFHDEGPVSPPGRSFNFGAGNAGRYIVLARLALGGGAQEDATAEFGVRGPELAGVPEEILRAQVADLNVLAIRDQLRLASQTGQQVTLQLGRTSVTVQRLRRLQTFEPDPGAQLPAALEGLETYQGEVAGNSNSVVVLNVGVDAAEGNDLNAMILINPPAGASNSNELQSTTWVEPLRLYNSNSPPQAHLIYQGSDVILMPDDHDGPGANPADAPGPDALAALTQSFDAAAVIIDNKIVRVRVYEHRVNNTRTRRRCSIVYCWAGQVTSEFRNITPIATTNRRVTVTDVRIAWWESISSSGYSGSCRDVTTKFRNDHDGVNNRLYVLFTGTGSGCGGWAFLGQGSRTRWHCIIRDGNSSIYHNAIILAQEVGHNWDWHTSWNDTPSWTPHDPHTCGCISERWNHRHGWWIFSWDHRHCTAMRASYDGCTSGAELRYRRSSGTGLRHLAEGIWRYH